MAPKTKAIFLDYAWLKNFLRPSIWKIMVAFLFPLYLTYNLHYQMAIPPQPSTWYEITLLPLPLVLSYFFMLTNSGTYPIPVAALDLFLDYAVPFIINYLIACGILHLYNRKK